MFSQFGSNLQSKVRNPASTIKNLVDLLGPLLGNVTETEEGRDVQISDPATSDFADALTGASGLLQLLQGDATPGNLLDLVGVGADLGVPGPPLAAFLAPLFHGTASSNIPRILEKGIEPIRDVGARGFSGGKKRQAAFASTDADIAAGFADEKTRRIVEAAKLENIQKAIEPPVVLGLDPSVVSQPNFVDELFPGEAAVGFPEGIPEEFIRKGFIPREGVSLPMLFEAMDALKQRGSSVLSPQGFAEVTIDGLMRFLAEIGR